MIDTVGEREGKSWRTKISRLIYYRVSEVLKFALDEARRDERKRCDG